MPIFDNELVNNISDRNYESPVDRPLGSPAFDEINGLQNLGIPGQFNESYGGITAEEARNFKSPNGPMTPNSPFSMVSKSELLANQRYPLYERGVDLENIYGLQQSGLEQLGNGLMKMGAFALGTFGQSFATIPNTFSAIKNGKFSELSNPDGYEATIDNWTKNLEDYFPNYVTRYEQSRGLATAIPFTYGSANFWGDKILKNTGFMVGAIGGALVQDAAIGAVTEGVGAIPLVAAQLGKASLYLNRLFSTTTKVDRVLEKAIQAGKSTQTLLNIERLGQLAAAQKLNSGFRYTMSVYGSARTEAAIEARESYETISKKLIEDYRLENGVDPTGQDLQEIENYATDAMNTRFGINMALLTVSNAVQFDNLFKTFTSAQKGITSSTVRNFEDAGKLGLKEGSLDVFEKKVPATLTGKVWDIAKPRAANIITEGVYEEGGQFATQKGVEDYYTRKYKNKESWEFVKEAMTSTTKGMAEQFGSSEGIESMIVGGITAALTGEAMSLVDRAKGRGKNKRLESAINIMNQYGMTGILSEKYQDTSRGLEIARQMQDAVASNNIFKYKNLKSDMLFNFVKSRLPIGMHDVTIEQLNMLKELPKKEFEKTFGMDFSTSNKETVVQYVDSIIAKANQIKDTVDGVNSMFNNPYRRIIDPKTDEEKLENAKYTTFENFKTDVSALSVIQQDVDSRLFDIQTSVSQVNPLVSNDLISTLTNSKGIKELSDSYEQKANSLSESLTTIEPSKRARVREEIKKLRTLSEKISIALSSGNVDPSLFNTLLNFELNNQDFSKSNVVGLDKSQKLITFSEDINKLKERKRKAEEAFDYLSTEEGFNKYFAYESSETTEETDVPKETIKIKTSTGEIDIETNTQYKLGRIVDYTKDGKEVYRAPIIEVIGENEDGTIKIKDVTKGDIFDVSKETIADYNLYKESDLSPIADFIEKNFNTKFRHKGLKNNGKPAIGRIFNQRGQIIFEYIDYKGNVKRVPVKKNQFDPQGNYKTGMITPVGNYTAAQEKSLRDLLSVKEKISDSEIVVRNQFLSKLYEDGMKRIQEIEKSLSSKKQEIEKISKKIEDLTLTKTGAPRKRITSTLRQQIDSLAKLRTSLEKQLEAEQNEKEELEYTVPFFKDMIEELSEFPEDNSAFIDKLKSDVNLLEDLINITDRSINDGRNLLSHVEDLLINALEIFGDYVKRLKEENPNIPLFLDEFISNLEKFYGEEGVKLFIEQRQGFTAKVLELEADINDFENELNIPGLTKRADTLVEEIKDLSEGIDKLIGEKIARREVLEKFQKFVDEKKQMEAEEEALSTNIKFREQALKTEDKSTVQTKYTNPNYEPNKKKASNILPISTVGIDRGKPHQTRAKIFAANLSKYKDVYGVYVSVNNEAAYGLEGLTDLIRTDDGVINESLNADKILAMVMVNGNGELLGVDGKPLTEEQLADAKNHAIFQVKPDPEFTWKSEKYGKGEEASMFRKGTPENVKKAVIEKYTKEKEELLQLTERSSLHTVAASWGIPEFELTEEGEINYEAKNSVESTGLIDKTTDKGNNSLEGQQVVNIPTLNDVESQGLTSYSDALGKPFLMKDNAVVPLINKKHTQEEAESIFNSLLELSKIAMEGKKGMKDPKAVRILNYLRGVVYWGIPVKNTGYNSIFFDTNPQTGKLTLTISNKGYDVVFTPSELERNRGEVIDKIKNLHNNINSSLIKKINQKFEQIVSISPSGEIKSIIWPNYQSYLLADRFPDADGKITTKGKKRESNDIPLTTPMRKLKNNEDVNRHSIYFYTTDNLDDYTFQELKEAKKEASKKMTPGAVSSKSGAKYKLDNETDNLFITPKGKELFFTSPSNVNEDNFLSVIKLAIEPSVMAGFIESEQKYNPELTEEEAKDAVVKNLKAGIFKSIVEFKSQPVEGASTETGGASKLGMLSKRTASKTEAPTPTEKAPVSTDAKPAEGGSKLGMLKGKTSEVEVEQPGEKKMTIEELRAKRTENLSKPKPKDTGLRVVINQKINSVENWNEVEAFVKKAMPTIPFYRVKNILQATNGRQAWGMLQDGAIYVYENAEVGTAYHEVFEAIWKMFSTPEEQQNIIKEFKSRTGTFVDRPTGKTVKYSEATNQEIKEQLAEEFRDYVQFKKVPVKPKDGRPYIVKLFADIVNAIKAFFLGPQAARNTEELFKRIGKGYYAKNNKYSTALSYANKGIIDINDVEVSEEAELREKLSDFEMSDVVEEMTYATIVELVSTDKNLFQEIDLPKSELYPMLEAHIENLLMSELDETERMYEDGEISKEEYEMLIEQDELIVLERINEFRNSWDEIVVKFEEKLNSFGIEFDENDNVQLTNEDKTKEIEYDATKIDHYKKANPAIKLLLATLPKMNADGTRVLSSINGNKMIPVGQVYVSLLNNLSSSKNTDEMLRNLKEMAKNDINYRRLYKRLIKQDYDQGDPSLSKIKYTHEARLISALWKSVKKYNADVRNVQILDNGDVNVGVTALSTVANQLRDKYISNIIADAKQNKGYFTYNESVKAYTGNPIRLKNINLTTKEGIVNFLNNIGISFSVNELTNFEINSPKEYKKFRDKAVFGIRESISKAEPISKFTKTSLGISGHLLEIAYVKAKLENPIVNSTHYNINGDLTQSYIGPNVPSQLYEFLSSAEGLTPEAFQNFPHLSYLLTDSFVEGSVLLDKMFTGDRTQRKKGDDVDYLFKVGYVGGLNNEQKGKAKESAKLNYKERLIQELNLNLEGWYLNLVPGDSSLEHDVYMSNLTSADELTSGMDIVNSVFKGYFMSELKVSREDRPVVEGRNSKDLRFFKSILADQSQKTDAKINKLHNDIINEPETKTPEEVYKKYEKRINAALDKFIEADTIELINTLISYNIIKSETSMSGETTYTVSNIKIDGRLSKEELFRTFKAITINYMSANIELQKLIYSDPYQYSDQLKRTKSFLSPRQLIVGGQDPINGVFNEVWNKGYEKNDIGNTDFTAEAFRTVTLQDVTGVVDLPGYSDYTETDGSGIMTMKANRHLRIRAGEWNDAEERQYKYEVAWEKRDKSEGLSKEEIQKRGLTLSEEEKEILENGNPEVQSAFTSQKPIVSGNKADGNPWNDVVLDKYALYPLTYRIVKQLNPDSNAVKLYNKMQAENIDYVIFESGRKVGAMNAHAPYVNGEFNNAPFVEEGEGRNIVNVPFEIMGIQTEVPSKEKALVTRGSQVTKLMTLDFMNAGVPIDFEVLDSNSQPIKDFSTIYSQWYSLSKEEKLEKSELYREMTKNQELLEAITEEGYNSLLKSLGIVKTEEGFRIVDKSKTANTLRNEILKREVNDNVSQALLQFFDNDVILESTPAYQQVRNILYSIADREFISPKMSGGQKVQIPSTFLESVRGKETTINGKTGYTSNNLKFYTNKDGERVAEFMVGRWFKSDKTDAELLEYFNDPNNKEAQRILSGVAFRIPTQKQNSIDRFVIKQFLPKEFGDNVVVPAELVAKVGSDFDIDKLSMYFKNVKIDKDGFPKLIEFLTDENSTVEERYIQYIKSKTDDYRDIIKELNESSEKLDTKEKIKANFEKVNESRLEKEEYKTEKENLYNEGLEIFSELPSAVREVYYEFEKRLREAEVEGLEKNLFYKRFTQNLIKDYTENKTVKIVTSEGVEVTVSSKTVLPIFNTLIENYDAVTKAYGVSQELQSKFLNLLDSAKSFKEFLTNKFELERAKVIAEFTGAETIEEFSNKSIYLQNGKKALQNAYIESSENLVSHPLNFNALIQPNSADQLKNLSKTIVEQTVGSTFDYKNVGNMLRRNFMSRLRHAFVTGKYAIGIAAVNQTNTALSQRQPILLDSTMIKGEDKYWLDNGAISFKNHNKVSINGRVFPTLSLIKNAERSDKYPDGQDISDIIGQFIDGYVDISKGPWIMELGATPNVASTWLFLVKLGVPVDEVAYFMNQPIIRDYLKSVETAGYSYLFMEDFVDNMLLKYTNGPRLEKPEITLNKRRAFKMPNLDSLKKSVGKSVDKMNAQELDQQRIMLFEFLKYAKMGEHLFHVTQGSNFDTSAFNDPYLVFKKQVQLVKAQNTMLVSIGEDGKKIIPAVNALLDNSFIGTLAQSIYNFRDSVSESGILMSDKKNVRAVLQNVLSEYVDMNNRDFVKLAQKAVNDFFDWIVQTKNGDESLNKYIKEYLVDNGGMTPEIVSFLKSVKDNTNHPLNGNMVIESMQVVPSSKAETGGANNIKVKPLSNEVVDQNSIIFAFRELRDYLEETGGEYENLYEQIVLTSMLQSGLSNSPISFSSILPYEDFQPLYNSVLSRIDNIPGINEFYELGVFQKNNWNNDDIVPNEKAGYIPLLEVYNPAMAFLKEPIKQAISKNQLPVMLTQSIRSRSARFNHMVYSYEVNVPITEADKKAGIKKQKQKKDQMRKAGNYSFIKKGLFKKVINPTTNMPLISSYTDKFGNLKEYFVYKLVNAWGESYRANEFYDYERPSVIDNGMMTTDVFDDALITDAFKGGKKSLSQRLAAASTAPTNKNVKNVSTNAPTNFNIEEDYMFEPFSYSEDNFDIYDEPKNLVSLPSEVEDMTNPQYQGKEEFNKLPGKSITPTMTYAGIGSRQTPPEILAQMTEVARELSATYTLNTGVTFGGKKEGADKAFDDGATKKNLFSPENQGSRSREQAIAKEIHPNPSALSPGAMRLMARNTNQVFGDSLDTPVDFVLFYAKETKGIRPEGGTGQAVQMARMKGIPTINMANPNWRQELDRVLSLPTEVVTEPTQVTEGIIKMQPDNIAKIKAGTKTITNRTEKEKLKDGVYTLPDGTKVQVKLLGKYFVTFDVAPREGYNGPVFSQDEYARAEGFKDWKDFEKNNKFSTNFINGNQDRLVYDIKVINTNQNKPKGLPSINRTNKKC